MTDCNAVIQELAKEISLRLESDPELSYVASLSGPNQEQVLKKIGEEAIETILAAKSGDSAMIIRESADLMFHLMVLLTQHGLGLDQVFEELQNRRGVSGLQEKALRSAVKSG